MSGFFSKDLILERLAYTNFSSLLQMLVFINVCFTYFYTIKLINYGVSSEKTASYRLKTAVPKTQGLLLVSLGLVSLIAGKILGRTIAWIRIHPLRSFQLKIIPRLALTVTLVGFLLGIKLFIKTNHKTVYILGNMLLLTPFILNVISKIYF